MVHDWRRDEGSRRLVSRAWIDLSQSSRDTRHLQQSEHRWFLPSMFGSTRGLLSDSLRDSSMPPLIAAHSHLRRQFASMLRFSSMVERMLLLQPLTASRKTIVL